jgi:YVTN family beta-propeller protein
VSISVSEDGKRAYVANSGSNNLSVIDTDARKVLTTIPVGANPAKAAVSPDGKSVVVSLRGEDAVAVLDTARAQVRNRIAIPGCSQPDATTILPDSGKAFVACSGGSQVAAVLLKKADAKQDDDRLLALLNVGKTPVHLALKPDGGEIFVSNADSGTFSEIATQANEVGGSYLVGERPTRGTVAADNATLYVSNSGSNTVAIYDITVSKLLAVIHVGNGPQSLTLSPNGNYLYVADVDSGDVTVIRTAVRSLFTIIPVGRQPSAMVTKAFAVRK